MPSNSYQTNKRAGEVVFQEGDPADCAYVIDKGRIEISVIREDSTVVLSELGPGEILGEMAVIDQYSRTATARVVEDCCLTVVTPHQIQQRIKDSDPVVRSLLSVLLTRYRSELSLEQGVPMETESALLFHTKGIEKIRFENELRRALEDSEVNVVYQPIRSLRTGTTNGFEALVRWDHPTEGTIAPEKLIALAEETDLIVPLSLYVFKAAVNVFADFQAASTNGLFVAVNVSPKHTVDSGFLNQAWDICAEAGARPGDIVLELTESIMVDIDQLSSWVRTAKAMGFRISVDDFGTGYASLEYLTRLEPHTVKIDQNFIRPLVEERRHQVVMRKVLEMARELDVLVIAEGAESAEHVRILAELDCDMAQGYEIGRPLTRLGVFDLLAGALDS
ncbi:MAG: EAL domain-containing protein [Gammaproteobacteria bacterium]|nr:EAL domain-containing protein [Gammaproteobacteria bacterium]